VPPRPDNFSDSESSNSDFGVERIRLRAGRFSISSQSIPIPSRANPIPGRTVRPQVVITTTIALQRFTPVGLFGKIKSFARNSQKNRTYNSENLYVRFRKNIRTFSANRTYVFGKTYVQIFWNVVMFFSGVRIPATSQPTR
jgi:hypothetical protein